MNTQALAVSEGSVTVFALPLRPEDAEIPFSETLCVLYAETMKKIPVDSVTSSSSFGATTLGGFWPAL